MGPRGRRHGERGRGARPGSPRGSCAAPTPERDPRARAGATTPLLAAELARAVARSRSASCREGVGPALLPGAGARPRPRHRRAARARRPRRSRSGPSPTRCSTASASPSSSRCARACWRCRSTRRCDPHEHAGGRAHVLSNGGIEERVAAASRSALNARRSRSRLRSDLRCRAAPARQRHDDDRRLLVLVARRVVRRARRVTQASVDARRRADDPGAGEVVGVDDGDVAAQRRGELGGQRVGLARGRRSGGGRAAAGSGDVVDHRRARAGDPVEPAAAAERACPPRPPPCRRAPRAAGLHDRPLHALGAVQRADLADEAAQSAGQRARASPARAGRSGPGRRRRRSPPGR